MQGQLAGGRAGGLRGTLQLAAPSDLGRNVLLPWLDAFQAEHLGIDIRLQLADRVANVYSEPVDAAFRYGKPQDSSLVALPLAADHRRVLCAAPAYLAAHGMPDTPHALAEHQGLCFMLGEDVHDRWRFWDAAGQEVVVRVRSRNVANDGDVVRRWAVLGRGIAYKSYFDAADDLAAGRLVPLCPGWTTEAVPLFLVAPSRRQFTPLVRALRDSWLAPAGAHGGAGAPLSASSNRMRSADLPHEALPAAGNAHATGAAHPCAATIAPFAAATERGALRSPVPGAAATPSTEKDNHAEFRLPQPHPHRLRPGAHCRPGCWCPLPPRC